MAKTVSRRSAPARPRKSQADRSSESEFRLLSAAAQILVEEGYSALTFDRVGEVSGFSRGLAGQKFGSKDGLVLAVVEFLNNNIDASNAQDIQLAPNPLEEIMCYLRFFFDRVIDDKLALSYFVLLAATIANKSAVHPAFVDAHERVKRTLCDMIVRGQASGVINPHLAPDTAALSIGAFQLGVATQRLLDSQFDVRQVCAMALPTIQASLAAPAKATP